MLVKLVVALIWAWKTSMEHLQAKERSGNKAEAFGGQRALIAQEQHEEQG